MGKRIQQKILGGEKKSNLSKNILPWGTPDLEMNIGVSHPWPNSRRSSRYILKVARKYLYLSVYLFIYQSIHLSIFFFYLSIYLSISLSIYLSISLSIYLSIYQSIFRTRTWLSCLSARTPTRSSTTSARSDTAASAQYTMPGNYIYH